MKSLYSYQSYKTYLKDFIGKNGKGTSSKLAEAAQCQRSYLSDVLNGSIHITPDHAFGISQYLDLSESEQEYFSCLVAYERAGHIKYKHHLQKKIEQDRIEHLRLTSQIQNKNEKSVQVNENELSNWTQYYSSWIYAVIHIATSIENLQTPHAIQKHLNLPISTVTDALNYLLQMNLIIYQRERYTYNFDNHQLHLSDKSILSKINHTNIRNLASVRSFLNPDDLNYSAVFSISKSNLNSLRNLALDFIKDKREMVQNSGCETLVAVTLDFFEI